MKILYDYFTNIAENCSQINISNKYIESSGSSSYVLKKVANSFDLKRLCFHESMRVEYEKVKGGLFIRFKFGSRVGKETELINKDISNLLTEILNINREILL